MQTLNCPFCNTKDSAIIKQRYRKGTANRIMYWVKCENCGVEQRHDNLAGYRTISKAIETWNNKIVF